jgi:hypothetical protein
MDRKTRRWSVTALILACALAFAACGNGATGTPDGDALQQEPSPNGAEEQNGQEDAGESETGDSAGDEPASSGNDAGENETGDTLNPDGPVESPASGEPPAQTKDVEVEVEGMKETRTGTLTVSDNGYHLYVIPPYVFTAEEPGADVVYMEAFPDYSMRIQALPADTDPAFLRQIAEEELKTTGGSFEERKGDAIYDPRLRGAEFYLQSVDEELVKKIIVMKIDGLLFRFTMFLPVGGEASDGAESGFNAMIGTVRAH